MNSHLDVEVQSKGNVGRHGDEAADGDGGEDAVDGRPHGAASQDHDVEDVGGDAEHAYDHTQVPVNTPVPGVRGYNQVIFFGVL